MGPLHLLDDDTRPARLGWPHCRVHSTRCGAYSGVGTLQMAPRAHQRCLHCGGEAIAGILPDGTEVLLTPVKAEKHVCDIWQAMLAAVLPTSEKASTIS